MSMFVVHSEVLLFTVDRAGRGEGGVWDTF